MATTRLPSMPPTPHRAPAMVPNGWKIQIAAAPNRKSAKATRPSQGQGGEASRGASPYTEPVIKGTSTLYRARFAGFKTQGIGAGRLRLPQPSRDFSCLALQ